MTDWQDKALQIAAHRYRLIADAAEADGPGVTIAIERSAKRPHDDADERAQRYTSRTLWRWLQAYRQSGLTGLMPRRRSDAGKRKAISDKVLHKAIGLRKQNPHRATATLIDMLERTDVVEPGSLKRSTLDRHLGSAGVSRRVLRTVGDKVFGKIATEYPLQLVIGDFHHGPYVRTRGGGDDGARRALLLCFIDHFSRYIPEGRYYLHEDFAALRFGFRRLLLIHGPCDKMYVDNGPSFQSHRFAAACSNEHLGIQLVHSKPYRAEGRGCCERFNRTVKEQFESEVKGGDELLTLDELNAYFEAWLAERYHRDIHSETGQSPYERFSKHVTVRQAPDLQLIDELLRLRKPVRVHPKWATAQVQTIRYQVDAALRGCRVHALYDIFDNSYVLIEYQGRIVQRAYPQQRGHGPVQPERLTEPVPASDTDYLKLLRQGYEARTAAELGALGILAPQRKKELPLVELQTLLTECRANPLTDAERSLVGAFFRKFRPLPTESIRAAVQSTRRKLGVGLHISVYLDALQTSLLNERKKGKKSL